MKARTIQICVGITLLFAMSIAPYSCKDKTGVCTACCGSSGTTYCKDGWSESECKDWSNQKVNGLSWTWHEGQTCAGRGTPATP